MAITKQEDIEEIRKAAVALSEVKEKTARLSGMVSVRLNKRTVVITRPGNVENFKRRLAECAERYG